MASEECPWCSTVGHETSSSPTTSCGLARPSLPLRWVSARMKDGKHNDHGLLHRKVDGVWEASEQCSSDPRSEMLILERTGHNPVVSGPQFIEEFDPQARLFVLVPIKNRLDIKIGLGS